MNHFMLNKIGIPSYYGQAFIPDICELDLTSKCAIISHISSALSNA